MNRTCKPAVIDTLCSVTYIGLFLYQRDFMQSHHKKHETDVLTVKSTFIYMYLDDVLNIDNYYFDRMFQQIFPT